MPNMMEIYKKHAPNYDELVNAEDYRQNLNTFLLEAIDWREKTVIEAGIGTGRVTRIYMDQVRRIFGFDREQHMLDQCRKNLHQCDPEKLILDMADNTRLPPILESADIFIEGWSFGHTVGENKTTFETVFKNIHETICRMLKPNGIIVLIETLGTNTTEPGAPSQTLASFYKLLENQYQFHRHVISTDYKFPSCQEAARVMGFFFGEQMEADILKSGICIIPEFTGIWVKRLGDC